MAASAAERWSQVIENHGITKFSPNLTREAVVQIIRDYTREAGVRNLEREIASTCRKLARKATSGELKKKQENLSKKFW